MFVRIAVLVRRFTRRQNGATTIEYGVIAALMALAALPGLSKVGGKVAGTFAIINTALQSTAPAAGKPPGTDAPQGMRGAGS